MKGTGAHEMHRQHPRTKQLRKSRGANSGNMFAKRWGFSRVHRGTTMLACTMTFFLALIYPRWWCAKAELLLSTEEMGAGRGAGAMSFIRALATTAVGSVPSERSTQNRSSQVPPATANESMPSVSPSVRPANMNWLSACSASSLQLPWKVESSQAVAAAAFIMQRSEADLLASNDYLSLVCSYRSLFVHILDHPSILPTPFLDLVNITLIADYLIWNETSFSNRTLVPPPFKWRVRSLFLRWAMGGLLFADNLDAAVDYFVSKRLIKDVLDRSQNLSLQDAWWGVWVLYIACFQIITIADHASPATPGLAAAVRLRRALLLLNTERNLDWNSVLTNALESIIDESVPVVPQSDSNSSQAAPINAQMAVARSHILLQVAWSIAGGCALAILIAVAMLLYVWLRKKYSSSSSASSQSEALAPPTSIQQGADEESAMATVPSNTVFAPVVLPNGKTLVGMTQKQLSIDVEEGLMHDNEAKGSPHDADEEGNANS